ncbi:MAG TPA: hypothetical protein VN611_00185 [Patescibacteria group bacterium]|nr:hypothetical protein [Patescibacteria group bacterium]
MKIWQWFCRLGTPASSPQPIFWRHSRPQQASGVEVCTRLCGQQGCRCGGTMRGLHCIWSYYREE